MTEIRYYNNNKGPIKENETSAVRKALEICNEVGDIEEIILLIHTKRQTTYIERVFEMSNVKKLFSNTIIHPKFPPFRIETVKTFNSDYPSKKIVVAFGLRSSELYKYDDFQSIYALIAHQWVEPDLKDWAEKWGAINIDTGLAIESVELPDLVVQNAFKDLTSSINMSTGIVNSSDNALCKTYIRALKKYNYKLDSKKIYAFLTKNLNWDYDDANDVIKLIDKVNSGGYFQGGDKTGLQHHIKKWKE
ncbi:hypothetical protein [Tenacibaculum singaporense]|uniref:Uncharacterized protein n=1 Tax=Tenacibaculum singaporense TaxID=2358479 RepID=A0A3Q8RS86_9FLAO|nr:hypothetical protein [Tenacibaculum singaporense]AZJ35981.1 hypothetical protein D6T69_10785 [Tenacibaculum singaporense]